MRLVVVLAVMCLAGCASEKLAQAPPAGVDFSGVWKLDEADSDDPRRLIQAEFNTPAAGQSDPSGGQGGGSSGRGGRGRGGAGGMNVGGPGGPFMPSVSAMGAGLRWPGKHLEIKQVAGVVAFSSDGLNQVCQPSGGGRVHHHHHHAEDSRDGDAEGRDEPRARDAPPFHCGWEDKTLIVRGGESDEDHPPFDQRYSLSDDRQRLVEVVGFKGGRSSGFTMSRVWDRAK